MRIVSLVPSATETLYALGVAPVGVSRFCDVTGPAIVGGTKNPDVATIVALAPDLVVVNDEENRAEDADALTVAGLRLHSMSPRSVADVEPAVRALARAVGAPAPPTVSPKVVPTRATAFCAVWRRPWMSIASDTYGSSLLELIGVRNVCADASTRYPELTLTEIAAHSPDLVLLPSEPYAFAARHIPEVQSALPDAQVLLVDGRDLFWWGARTPAAADRLAGALFGDAGRAELA
ncbi:MAG: helical backbone metal receptor [Actinomycetota bacterium]